MNELLNLPYEYRFLFLTGLLIGMYLNGTLRIILDANTFLGKLVFEFLTEDNKVIQKRKRNIERNIRSEIVIKIKHPGIKPKQFSIKRKTNEL